MAVFVDRFITQVQLLGAARFSKQLVNLGTAAQTFGVMAAASLGGELVGASIKAAAEFEKVELQLKQIFGSNGAAQEARKWAADFSNRTPFEMQDVMDAFIALSARGIQPTARNMELLGDLAASRGQTMERAALAAADAQQGFFRRLEDTFALTKEQIIATDRSMVDSQGKIRDTTKLLEGLFTLISRDPKIAGSMKTMEKSWETMVSNMKGKWKELFADIGNAGPVGAGKGLMGFLTELPERIRIIFHGINMGLLTWAITFNEAVNKFAEWFHRFRRAGTLSPHHREALEEGKARTKRLAQAYKNSLAIAAGDKGGIGNIQKSPGAGGSGTGSAISNMIRDIIGGGEIAKIGVRPSEFPGMGPARNKPPVTVRIETSEGSAFNDFIEDAINRALNKLTQHGAIDPA